jgi:putative transposase
MRRSRFTEAQILAALKEAGSGKPAFEIARKYGISPATFYNWKAKYDRSDPSPQRQLREMAAELAQYKTMYAELALENFSLRNQLNNPTHKLSKEPHGPKEEDGDE